MLLLLVCLVQADVKITSPTGGSFSASGGTVEVSLKWEDDGDSDATDLSQVQSYTISLCTGPNDDIECFHTIVDGKTVSSKSVNAQIKASDAPNGWYYFQIYSVFPKGFTNHYSPRFQLKGMSGESAATITGKPTTLVVTATGDPPEAQVSASDTINSKSFSLRYTDQTGSTKFAPMQTQPGSKVTATTWSMKYPTSAVTYYSLAAGSPNARTTATPGWDYTPTSLPNWAPVAPYPTYFYPASQRVTKASLLSAKKKRWFD